MTVQEFRLNIKIFVYFALPTCKRYILFYVFWQKQAMLEFYFCTPFTFFATLGVNKENKTNKQKHFGYTYVAVQKLPLVQFF